MGRPQPILMPSEEVPLENEALGMSLEPAALALDQGRPVNQAELDAWDEQQRARAEGLLTCGGELAHPAAYAEACAAGGIDAAECAEMYDEEWMAACDAPVVNGFDACAASRPSEVDHALAQHYHEVPSIGADPGGRPLSREELAAWADPGKQIRRDLDQIRRNPGGASANLVHEAVSNGTGAEDMAARRRAIQLGSNVWDIASSLIAYRAAPNHPANIAKPPSGTGTQSADQPNVMGPSRISASRVPTHPLGSGSKKINEHLDAEVKALEE